MINILYEDNHLLVVLKEPNIPVCADSSNDMDLLSILKDYIRNKYKSKRCGKINQEIRSQLNKIYEIEEN